MKTRAIRTGVYRSRLEARIIPPLLAYGAKYEPVYLRYVSPPRRYIPDVVLANGIAVEVKGWFPPADRAKLLLVKETFPALDLRMVLASPQQKISRSSKTTQAVWCEQHGIPWADNAVPKAWLAEDTNAASKKLLDEAPQRETR